jgi:hypothetical protein
MDNLLHLIFVRLWAGQISRTRLLEQHSHCVNSKGRLLTTTLTGRPTERYHYSIASETDRKAKQSALMKTNRNKASYNRNNAQVALRESRATSTLRLLVRRAKPYENPFTTRKAIINGVVFGALDQTSDVGEDPPWHARSTAVYLAPLLLLNGEFELSTDFFLAAYLRFIALVSRTKAGCRASTHCTLPHHLPPFPFPVQLFQPSYARHNQAEEWRGGRPQRCSQALYEAF